MIVSKPTNPIMNGNLKESCLLEYHDDLKLLQVMFEYDSVPDIRKVIV